jgi:hypothetical protein
VPVLAAVVVLAPAFAAVGLELLLLLPQPAATIAAAMIAVIASHALRTCLVTFCPPL